MKTAGIFFMCLGLCGCAALDGAGNCYGSGNEECVKKGYRTDQVVEETTIYEANKQKALAKEFSQILSSCGIDLYAKGASPLTKTQSKCAYDKTYENICATGKFECNFKNFEEFEKMLNANIENAKKQ